MTQISEFEWALENGDILTQQDGSPILLSSAHNRILIRSSTTPGAVPSAGILEIGELAVNTADARIYFKQPAGNVTEVAAGKLSVARNFTLTGDVTGTTSSDLSGTVSITATLGTVSISKGGTGLTTAPTTSQILVGQSNGSYALRTLTAGENVTITEAGGNLTITAGGGATVTVSETPPASPDNGDLWFDSSLGILRVYYVGASSSAWVDASAGFGSGGSLLKDSLTTSTTAANQVVTQIPAAEYRSVKYTVQVTSGSSYQTSEVLIVHDGTTAYITEYAIITTGSSLATFNADVSGGNLRLLTTPANAVSTIRTVGHAVTV